MTWVLKQEDLPQPHYCERPDLYKEARGLQLVHNGRPGDLWRCDECHQLWVMVRERWAGMREWRKAGWWLRRQYPYIPTESERPAHDDSLHD